VILQQRKHLREDIVIDNLFSEFLSVFGDLGKTSADLPLELKVFMDQKIGEERHCSLVY
jgi:hypothetical protein